MYSRQELFRQLVLTLVQNDNDELLNYLMKNRQNVTDHELAYYTSYPKRTYEDYVEWQELGFNEKENKWLNNQELANNEKLENPSQLEIGNQLFKELLLESKKNLNPTMDFLLAKEMVKYLNWRVNLNEESPLVNYNPPEEYQSAQDVDSSDYETDSEYEYVTDSEDQDSEYESDVDQNDSEYEYEYVTDSEYEEELESEEDQKMPVMDQLGDDFPEQMLTTVMTDVDRYSWMNLLNNWLNIGLGDTNSNRVLFSHLFNGGFLSDDQWNDIMLSEEFWDLSVTCIEQNNMDFFNLIPPMLWSYDDLFELVWKACEVRNDTFVRYVDQVQPLFIHSFLHSLIHPADDHTDFDEDKLSKMVYLLNTVPLIVRLNKKVFKDMLKYDELWQPLMNQPVYDQDKVSQSIASYLVKSKQYEKLAEFASKLK